MYSIDGISVEAETKSDLFSPKDLDRGSRLLLECAKSVEYHSVLDWGCGWGAIGLWLAKAKPAAKVLALDSDIAAVAVTRQNAVTNLLNNFTVIPSHSFSEVPTGNTFDLIVTHPPTHRGREVVEAMVTESHERLVEGGQLLVVVEARIKPWLARSIKNVFGDYKILKRGPKYVVLRGSK